MPSADRTTLRKLLDLLNKTTIPSNNWNVPQVEFHCVVKGQDRYNPKAIGWRFKPNHPVHLYVRGDEYLVMKPIPPPVSIVTVTSFDVDTIKNTVVSTEMTLPKAEVLYPCGDVQSSTTIIKKMVPPVLSNQTNFAQSAQDLSRRGKKARKTWLSTTQPTGKGTVGITTPNTMKDNTDMSDIVYAPGSHHFLHYKDGVDYPVVVVKEVRSKKLLVKYLPPFGRTTATVTRKQLLEPTKERLYAYEQALELTKELQSQNRAKHACRRKATKKRGTSKVLPNRKGCRPKRSKKCNIKSEPKHQKTIIGRTKSFGQPIGHQNLPNYSESIVVQPHLNRKIYFAKKGETVQGISKNLNVTVERLIHDNRCIAPGEKWSSRTKFREFTPVVAPFCEESDVSYTDDDTDWIDSDDYSHSRKVTKQLPSREARNKSSFCGKGIKDEEQDDKTEDTMSSAPSGKVQGTLADAVDNDDNDDDDDTVTECTLPKLPKKRNQCSNRRYVFSDDITDDENDEEDAVSVCTRAENPCPPRQSHPALTPEKVVTEYFLEDTLTSHGNAIEYDSGFVI